MLFFRGRSAKRTELESNFVWSAKSYVWESLPLVQGQSEFNFGDHDFDHDVDECSSPTNEEVAHGSGKKVAF
jgi:hypothetical protein